MKTSSKGLTRYLRSTRFIDSNSSAVINFSRQVIGNVSNPRERSIKLYYAVRDSVRYSPYHVSLLPERFTGNWVLEKKVGFCIQKAILLAAVARAAGIPSRLGFADVRNHLTSERLAGLMKTDLFVFHGYTELFLDQKWIKATPAFDRACCERQGIKPLEFNGKTDSILQAFDRDGNRHMEYLNDYGHFDDFPLQKMIRAFKKEYPHFFKKNGTGWPVDNG
jgi:transglutaminase-like putative cysteine protease